jgi:hypothetical protein
MCVCTRWNRCNGQLKTGQRRRRKLVALALSLSDKVRWVAIERMFQTLFRVYVL